MNFLCKVSTTSSQFTSHYIIQPDSKHNRPPYPPTFQSGRVDSRKRWCRRSPWRRCWRPCSCSPRTCSSGTHHRQALLNSELYDLYQYIATYNLGTTQSPQLAPISRHAMFDNVGKYSAQQNHPKIKYKLCSKNSEKILDERH